MNLVCALENEKRLKATGIFLTKTYVLTVAKFYFNVKANDTNDLNNVKIENVFVRLIDKNEMFTENVGVTKVLSQKRCEPKMYENDVIILVVSYHVKV